MKVADTARLSFRLMNENDGEKLFELDQDPDVMKYINGGHMTTMDEVKSIFIPRMKRYTNEDKGWGLWMVTLNQTGEFIGWVLVRPMQFFTDNPEYDNLELGWRFKQAHWGKGYGTEAAAAVKDALIAEGSASKLTALAIEENEGSTNIMTKLGMTFIKKEMHKDPLGDQEVVFYAMDV